MSFYDLIAHFFLALNNVALSDYIRIYLSIHVLNYILAPVKLG